MKKSLGVLGAVTASALIVGCGGSSDTSSIDTVTDGGTTSQESIGTAYYKDSAIAGVNYVCGSQSGVTDENGTIKFEVGKGCVLTLGDISLRDVNASELNDNGTLWEVNSVVARVLQSLDEDQDASNGINIAPENIALLVDNGVLDIPATDEELATFQETVGTAITLVPESQSDKHLIASRLGGTTVYLNMSGMPATIVFNADFTGWTITVADQSQVGQFVSVLGNRFYFSDTSFVEIHEITDDYVLAQDGTVGPAGDIFPEPPYKMYFNADDVITEIVPTNDNEASAVLMQGTWQTTCIDVADANGLHGTNVEMSFDSEMMTSVFKRYANPGCDATNNEVINQYSVRYEYMVDDIPSLAADDGEAYPFVNSVAQTEVQIGTYEGPELGTQLLTMLRIHSPEKIEFATSGMDGVYNVFGAEPIAQTESGVATLMGGVTPTEPPVTEPPADVSSVVESITLADLTSDEWTYDAGLPMDNEGKFEYVTPDDIGADLGRNAMIPEGVISTCIAYYSSTQSMLTTRTVSLDEFNRGTIVHDTKIFTGNNQCSNPDAVIEKHYAYTEAFTVGAQALGEGGEKAYEWDTLVTGAITYVGESTITSLVGKEWYQLVYTAEMPNTGGLKAFVLSNGFGGSTPTDRADAFGNTSSLMKPVPQ